MIINNKNKIFNSDFYFAKYIYSLLERRRNILQFSKKKFISKNKLILLTTLFERDIFAFESCNIDTLFILGKSKYLLSQNFEDSLNKNQFMAYRIGRLFSGSTILNIGEIYYIVKSSLIWIVLIGISFLDFVLIILFIIYSLTIKKLFNTQKIHENKIFSKIRIYLNFYWKDKGSKSIHYYFPNFRKNLSNFYIVNMFYNYKFICKGILEAGINKNNINPFEYMDIVDLFISIKDLLIIFYLDLRVRDKFTYGDILSISATYKKISKRFYCLLISNIFPKINSHFSPHEIYIWHENQFYQRVLSLKIASLNDADPDSKLKIYTYIGSLFSRNYYPFYVPNYLELKNKLWANNDFILQDEISKLELNEVLIKHKLNFSIKVADEKLSRIKSLPYLRKINKDIKRRNFTIFTHANAFEIYVVLCRLFDYQIIKNNDLVYLRCHPLCSKDNAKKEIMKFMDIKTNSFLKFRFIENNQENIVDSMKKTNYCIFGESTYVNLALKLRYNVIAIKTSFIYDPPIQSIYKNLSNLKVI